ncbi:flagellar protein FlaG [Desulfolucanica intricata]|uniref:flagellar protein FlaG n=1 Tax=Desulfolucanica intricata TaxID=1285191 RepID=UPI00082E8AA8|nr:flagellar protein FlaG [Desulfolucanica intricata]
MKIGGGGLEAMAAYDLNTSVPKSGKSEPVDRKTELAALGDDGSSQSKLNLENLIKVVEKLNTTEELYNQNLNFQIHEETQGLVVQIVNQESGEVIKQIPPEEVLDLEARLREMVGIIIDKKV